MKNSPSSIAARFLSLLALAALPAGGAHADEAPFCKSETSNPWQHQHSGVTANSVAAVREKIVALNGALPPELGLKPDEKVYISFPTYEKHYIKELSANCGDRLTCPMVLDSENAQQARAWMAAAGDENGASPLGYCGPLGAYGPLGRFGPLGEFSTHDKPEPGLSIPQIVQNLNSPAWQWFGRDLGLEAGRAVLGESGPLGPKGPLGKAYCSFSDRLEQGAVIRAWSKHLQAGGVWTPLGPLGPLGALGPLGPLGQLGGAPTYFSVKKLDDGRIAYYDKERPSEARHCVTVPAGRTNGADCAEPAQGANGFPRLYELVEFVPARAAQTTKLTPAHTSFVIDGSFTSGPGGADSFTMTSRVSQYVTMVVVPGDPKDAFGVTVDLSASGSAAAATLRSDVKWPRYINFVQAYVEAGTAITVAVNYQSRSQTLPVCPPPFSQQIVSERLTNTARGEYRLIMVGSGAAINGTDVSGAQQVPY